jgi:fatty-acyl-CoA synthase
VIEAEAVRAYVKSRLSDYKVPKYVLTFESFPINASGKVVLKDLRVQAGEMINIK